VTSKKARHGDRGAHASKVQQLSRKNEMAVALRNIGQIERTLFTLDWLPDVELRRRVHARLNKGDAKITRAPAELGRRRLARIGCRHLVPRIPNPVRMTAYLLRRTRHS
jgi:hypothetical protein